MAAVSGAAAYKALEKPDNGVSQGLQYWGQIASQENAANKLAKEREKVQLDKESADFAKEYGNIDDMSAKVTQFDTFDHVAEDFSTKLKDKYTLEYRNAQTALTSGDLVKRRDAEMKMRRYKDSFKQVGDLSTILAKKFEEYQKDAADGKISGVDADNWEAQMESIIRDKNFRIDVDKNGSPIIIGIQKTSDGKEEDIYNDDGKGGKKLFTIKYSEIVNGDWRPYQKQDIGKTTGDILKGLGTYEELKEKGLMTIKSQLWNEKVETGAKQHISLLTGSDEVVADLLNQINGSKKKKDFTQEERNLVGNKILDLVKAGYKEKYEEKFNNELATHQRGLATIAETKRHNTKSESIAATNAQTAAYTAKTGRINATTAQERLNFDKTKDVKDTSPDVKISEPFVVKSGNIRKTYKTFTLSDKTTGTISPINMGVDGDGKAINISSVDIDTSSGSFRYKDGKGNVKTLTAKDDPNLYNTIYNQIIGRDEVTKGSSDVNVNDLRDEYNY